MTGGAGSGRMPLHIFRITMVKIAVIAAGGKQYLVKPGDTLRVEKIEEAAGGTVSFDVMLLADEDGSSVSVGTPLVKGASVTATVVQQGRARKVMVVKFKNKVRYKRNAGHRQPFTSVKIDEVKG